jgi:hypothetical protein
MTFCGKLIISNFNRYGGFRVPFLLLIIGGRSGQSILLNARSENWPSGG